MSLEGQTRKSLAQHMGLLHTLTADMKRTCRIGRLGSKPEELKMSKSGHPSTSASGHELTPLAGETDLRYLIELAHGPRAIADVEEQPLAKLARRVGALTLAQRQALRDPAQLSINGWLAGLD